MCFLLISSIIAPDKDGGKNPTADRYVKEVLYDLYADPYELENLVGHPTYREVANELCECLITRMTEAGEESPIIEPAPESSNPGRRTVFEHEILE